MDVTCERCGTEYEFDETLVSDRGTTVKCTQCGHMFKVYRPGSEPEGGIPSRPWQVVQRDGSSFSVGSLRELQRLITEGQLSEQDQISRSGGQWKTLGDIAELHTFFAAARAASGAQPNPASSGPGPAEPSRDPRAFARTIESDQPPSPAADSDTQADAGTQPSQPSAPSQAAAGPRQPHKGTLLGVGAGPQAPPSPQVSPQAAPSSSQAGGGPADATLPDSAPAPAQGDAQTAPAEGKHTPWAEGPGAPGPSDQGPPPRSPGHAETLPAGSLDTSPARPARAARQPDPAPASDAHGEPTHGDTSSSAASGASSAPPAAPSSGSATSSRRRLYVDEADAAEVPGHRPGRAGWWVVLMLLLVAGGGVALGWEHVAPLVGLGGADDPVRKFLERGDEALAKDHIDGYETAIREYTRATALAEKDPRVLTALARGHALWAQALHFDADDLEARAASGDETVKGEARRIRREQRRHADKARRYAEDAVRAAESKAAAQLALADALRLSEDLPGAKEHLGRAMDLAKEPTAEALRVRALISVKEVGGDVATAEADARKAVDADPDLVRARLLLARALLANRDVAGARGQIDAVLDRVPDHPRGSSLRQAIRKGIPPAHPVVAVLDGGVPPDAGRSDPDAGAPSRRSAQGVQAQGSPDRDRDRQGTPGSPGAEGTAQDSSGEGSGVPEGRDADWYIRRGEELQRRGEVGRAKKHFQAALDVRSGSSEALSGLGFIALDTGRPAEAVRRFKRASEQGYSEAFIGLGTAYRAVGKPDKALEAFQTYLDRWPSGSQASIAQNQVASLKPQVSGSNDDKDSGGDGNGSSSPASPSEPTQSESSSESSSETPSTDSLATESTP